MFRIVCATYQQRSFHITINTAAQYATGVPAPNAKLERILPHRADPMSTGG
jgi:hypothetical protein